MIEQVKQNISIPLIAGGGLRTAEKANQAALAGADIIVIGNALEKKSGLISEMADAVHRAGQK
jgi:putative glycerol-1-phosphate prenyltransferase